MRQLCVDLFCGLGGWAEGFLSEGYDVVGFDIERHQYGDAKYPAHLVIQDVLTLDGRQFRDADVIVASPPCQKYSYMAMPWTRAKDLIKWYREVEERQAELTALFDACFRIQRDAGIPMVVENVKGAQPWVGQARAHYGSFYLWGDIDTVNGSIVCGQRGFGCETLAMPLRSAKVPGVDWQNFGMPGYTAPSFRDNPSKKVCGDLNWNRKDGKPSLGFNTSADAQVHGRSMNFHDFEKTGQPGRSFQSSAVKIHGSGDAYWRKPLEAKRREATAVKNGGDWFSSGDGMSVQQSKNSHSTARKAASAMIAKIPFELSSYVARSFLP